MKKLIIFTGDEYHNIITCIQEAKHYLFLDEQRDKLSDNGYCAMDYLREALDILEDEE